MLALQATTLDDFKPQARRLLLHEIHPDDVMWIEGEGLFADSGLPDVEGAFTVPKAYLLIAERVACFCDVMRWGALYHLLWRLKHGEPTLLGDAGDPLIRWIETMAKCVGRDVHKMHAFVRFRKTVVDGQETYLAWHQPEHRILTLAAPFFVKRFKNQRWGIGTPDESCWWDMQALAWGDGVPQQAAPPSDEMEDLWRTYYRHIFNPARIKTKMMKSEMPVKYWKSMPETQDIPQMLRDAPERVQTMLKHALGSSERSLNRAAKVQANLERKGG